MQLTTTLEQSPALAGLTSDELSQFEDLAIVWDYKAGETIFHQGDEAFGLCIIESGEVGVEVEAGGRVVALHDLGPGQLIGWSGIIAPHQFNCSTVCRTDARLIIFKAKDIQRFIDENEHLGYELLNNINKMVLERLCETQARLAEAISWYRYCRGYPLS